MNFWLSFSRDENDVDGCGDGINNKNLLYYKRVMERVEQTRMVINVCEIIILYNKIHDKLAADLKIPIVRIQMTGSKWSKYPPAHSWCFYSCGHPSCNSLTFNFQDNPVNCVCYLGVTWTIPASLCNMKAKAYKVISSEGKSSSNDDDEALVWYILLHAVRLQGEHWGASPTLKSKV